jgi:translocation and assembly module TamB
MHTPPNEPNLSDAKRQPRKGSRRGQVVVFALAALLASPLLLALWLVSTESGLTALARGATALSGGRLVLQGEQGTLLGRFGFAELRLATPDVSVRARDVRLDWRPIDLLQRQLSVASLSAAELHVATAPATEAPALPQSLTLPLAVALDQFRIDRTVFGRLDADARAPRKDSVIVLSELSGALNSDGRMHAIKALHLAGPIGTVEGEARLDGRRPFALHAQASLAGSGDGHAYRATATAEGTLEAFTVRAQAQGLELDGQAVVDVTPFAPVPVAGARVDVTGIDPARFASGAPHAALRVHADLQPQRPHTGERALPPQQWTISGPVTVINEASGPLDRGALPARSLKALASWSAQRLRLEEVDLALTGKGQATGVAHYENGELDLRLALLEVSLLDLHTRLKPTRLAGELVATLTQMEQRLAGNLSEPRFSARFDARQRNGIVEVDAARLQSGVAQLDASGKIELGGAQAFAVRGRLQRFDPSLYVAVPRARLNADVSARGRLQPRAMQLSFALLDSRLADAPLSGRGKVELAPDRVVGGDVALDLAGNTLAAQGSFGHAGDTLRLRVDAPRLASLAGALGAKIGGSMKGEATLTGTLAQPAGQARFSAAELTLPTGDRAARLDVQADLREGADGRVQIRIDAAGLQPAGRGKPLADRAALTVEGTRRDHVLRGNAILDARNELAVEAAGGLVDPTSAEGDSPAWSGTLKTLALRGAAPWAFSMSARASLQASRSRVVLGPAELRAGEVRARLLETRWSPGETILRGELTNLPFGLALDEQLRIVVRGGTLRLGGSWDVRLGDHVNGIVRLFRESGDLELQGDAPVRLGLQQFELVAHADNDRLAAALDLRGTQAGRIAGSATAALARRAGGGWYLAQDAPLAGSLRIDVPSLIWVGPLVEPNLQTAGTLAAEFSVTGTAAAPRGQGTLRGDGLTIALADQGLRLGEGVLRADFDQDRLRLGELRFSDSVRVRPRESRLEVAALDVRPGTLSASGEMLLSSGKGEIGIRADHLPLLQRADRWLMVSGEGTLRTSWQAVALAARVSADAGYWEFARADAPKLGDDVVVLGRQPRASPHTAIGLDVETDLGRRFFLRGRGLDTRLAGNVRIKADEKHPPRATGSIRTRGGTYDAYGQFLAIERGILNFQGTLENPGLNVLALRKNLPVEAGVEITGTVLKPRVRLVSDPDVPDNEKLSWIVLGRAPDQVSGGESALLLSAAGALLGDESGGISRQLAHSLGIDQISVGTRDSARRGPTSAVVSGTGMSPGTVSSEIISLGKRLSSSAYLSYEQSLSGTDNVVKLTYNLARRLQLIGRAGTENAVDLFYTFSFN